MARKKPSPAAEQLSALHGRVFWKPTKNMNMRDLARDDDYLSHLFIEKLGSLGLDPDAPTPMLVHRMDPFRRLPKTHTTFILNIVQRLISARQTGSVAIKQAVNDLLELPSVLYFIKEYEQPQINAFATHASRYLELYLPTGSIEIAQTSRYSRITGKNELCIVATRPMQPGFLIAELKGSMADLTEEEDKELKRAGSRSDGGMRRDFSVIHSKQLKKNHLFLGPARFVNHDCDNNCELFRNGRYITFRAIKPIVVGQELTAHYGDGYFGRNNRHCLCETCERRGKGGYAPQTEGDDPSSSNNDESEGENESDSDTSSAASVDSEEGKQEVNLNERRTRRGVYLVIPEQQNDSDESDDENDDEDPPSAAKARDGSVATTTLTEISEPSMPSTSSNDVIDLTESGDSLSISAKPKRGRPLKASSVQTNTDSDVNSRASFKSVITTRGQKAREASLSSSISHLQTPPFGGGSAPPTQSHPSASSSSSNTPRLSLRLRKSDSVPAFTLPNGPRPRGRPRKHPLPCEVKAVDKAVEKLATRGRPSLAVKAATAAKAAKAEKEKAEKESSHQEIVPAVPSCATCLTPLSADNAETSRKGKAREFKEECTRCKRHYAIYRASWPQRNPTPGSRYSSTRENTPSEHASISTVDDKLKTARLAQLKRSREKEPEVELERARGTKRQKVSASPASPQKSISSFSGRTRVPSMKIRQHNEPEVKVEGIEDVPLHGPVGRTSRNSQKKNAEPENAVLISSSRKRGRPSATNESVVSPAEERLVDDDGDDRRDKTFWPALPSLPPVGDGIRRTGLLNMRPNPMLVSRWRTSPVRSTHSSDSTPTLVDDDTDEGTSDEHPATPENNGSTPEVVESTETSHDMPPNSDDDEENENDAEDTARLPKRLTISTFKSFGLIAKPSPLTLSKRVWAPPALIADPDCEELNPLAPSEPMSPKRKRRKHTPTPSPTQPEDTDSPAERTPTSARSARIFESQVRKSVFDDFDASSGEEDVIIPGPSDSNLYLLQSKVTFSSTTSAQNAPVGSPVRSNEDGPRDTVTPSSQSSQSSDTQGTRSSNILNPKIKPHTLGPLHSDFLSSVPVTGPSPTLANAGWESDSSA